MTNEIPRLSRGQGSSTPAIGETANALALEVDGLRYEADRAPARDGRKVCLSVRLAASAERPNFFDR
ncbi:MAG: hypothetical protein ACAI25_10360, partial [Planctomycetota bacterium]